MGRGKGKGKKMTINNHEDAGSGEEEKIPAQKRRGRPQKPLKDEIDDEDVEKIEEGNVESGKTNLSSKDRKSSTSSENGKKRRRNEQEKDKVADSVKEEENGSATPSVNDDSVKSNGFRHIGSRRKNTPRRAAEAGVACT